MRHPLKILISAVFLGGSACPSLLAAQSPPPTAPAAAAPRYADIAALVLRSPLVIDGRIRRVERLKGADAVGVAPGRIRLFVQADVLALIRGTDSLPARISYIVDIAPDPRGKLPQLKKMRVLVFAQPDRSAADQVRLTGLDSQRPWTPATDALARSITREVVAADAPPAITGIGNAFFVPGSLPGEGETQIFLTTDNDRPVSITVLRRPGEMRRWAVALSEIVDEAAAPPPRDTLLWYRLACGLPAALPDRSLASMDAAAADAARDDYRFVRQSLGPCEPSATAL